MGEMRLIIVDLGVCSTSLLMHDPNFSPTLRESPKCDVSQMREQVPEEVVVAVKENLVRLNVVETRTHDTTAPRESAVFVLCHV